MTTTENSASRGERRAAGKAARKASPLKGLAGIPSEVARDPVGLLVGQGQSRVPELLPIRYGRMLVSPFTYYRGAALPMAADLAAGPSSGLRVQLCGDAHLSNFGAFASPDRRLVFDINDFDETLPGPFEWDVKRLAASLEVAGRANGFSASQRRTIVAACASGYRLSMREFAGQSLMDVWYARLDFDQVIAGVKDELSKKRAKGATALLDKARTKDSMHALRKLTEQEGEGRRFISTPPTISPIEEVFPERASTEIYAQLHELLRGYGRTLQSDRRHLLEQFELVQVARKVVGVGSVGTRAWVLLMQAQPDNEPLLLQAKEAQASVLAKYCGRSKFANQGQRVVAGQHLMQAASDIFLGWRRVKGADGVNRDFYVRQLKDWKFSAPIELMSPKGLTLYAKACAWTLARAHARSGDRVAIASYLGGSEVFDEAIAKFSVAYADLNEQDYSALSAAAESGRIEATPGI